MLRRSLLLILSCLTFLPALSAATLKDAEAAYQAGNYKEAAADYLDIVRQNPPNASVFHNLGLAYDRDKALGPAIAAYLRAAQLQPREADFQYNLRFLLGEAQDKLDVSFPRPFPANLLADQWLSARELYYLTLALFLLLCAALSIAVLKKNLRSLTITGSLGLGLLVLYGAGSFFYKQSLARDQGAVASPTLSAYSGPSQSIVIFELHEGAPFQILETSGDWVKIELSDQKRGWVRKAGVVSFGRDLLLPGNDQSPKS